MGEVDDLKKELEDLKTELKGFIQKAPKEEGPKVVFAPKQRKVEKFSGRDGTQTVYEFVEEMLRVLKSRPTPPEEQADFILSHLEGPAKEELRYRSPGEKKDPNAILDLLSEAFAERSTASELMSDFYSTKQESGQSLREYSHSLMRKLDLVARVDPTFISNREKTLSNQFAENVSSVWLKRELKRSLRSKPKMSFSDLREEAIVLCSDDEPKERKKREAQVFAEAAAPSAGYDAMKSLVDDLRKEISSLREEFQDFKSTKGSFEKKCFKCQKPGHIKRNCPENEKNKDRLKE